MHHDRESENIRTSDFDLLPNKKHDAGFLVESPQILKMLDASRSSENCILLGLCEGFPRERTIFLLISRHGISTRSLRILHGHVYLSKV
jgi:hypothetical protein